MSRPKPDLHDPEYVAFAHLSNEIGRADTEQFVWLDTRESIAEHLWDMGYRRDESA